MESIGNMLKKMQISGGIDEESLAKMSQTAWIYGIICLAAFVFVAFALKDSRVLGIITGIVNAAAIILTPTMLKAFHEMEFFKTIYGTPDQLDNLVSEFYAEQIPKMIAYYGVTALSFAGFILSMVFIGKSMKFKPRVCGVLALIVRIVGYLFVAPIDSMAMFTGNVTVEKQISQASNFYLCTIIPLVLLVILAIVNLTKKPAPVVKAPVEEETEA